MNRSAGIGDARRLAERAASVDRCASEKLVTIRYGIPRRSSSTERLGRPGDRLALRRRCTPSGSRTKRADAGEGRAQVGSGEVGRSSRAMRRLRMLGDAREVPMGLLDGKKALIFGVANDHSIAWGIAQALHDEGATVGLLVGREPDREARPAAGRRRSARRSSSRATSSPTTTSRASSTRWGETHGALDILVHALAFAKREDLEGAFVDTSRDGFALALDVSAYSLVALTREARPLLQPGLVAS